MAQTTKASSSTEEDREMGLLSFIGMVSERLRKAHEAAAMANLKEQVAR